MCNVHTEYFGCGHKKVSETKCPKGSDSAIMCPNIEYTYYTVENWCTSCWDSNSKPKLMSAV